jgi:CheY-like chemotaxis protein/two-component sensor histidine kinase
VRHMTELIDDLLDVSRVTRGLVQLEMQPVDLQAVVAGAVEQARPLIESRRHTLALALDPVPAWVEGDRTRLVQILANLLNNAAKYTPQGGTITLALEHVTTPAESFVRLAVRDTGVGISAELLPHVFDLFTQAERTPDRAQGGLGLGLALVRSLVQLHGGRVRASSAGVGQGSTFVVELPLAAAPARNELPLASNRCGVTPKTLMIVDDNVDAAESLAEILRVAGHAVTVRTNPMDVLADVERGWPDVFILDIGLPDIDGYELARRLQARQPHAQSRYIALTGYGQSHDRVLSKTVGFCRHFVKPVDLQALLASIDAPRTEGENCSTT